jgi:hypothetical protein
MRRLTFRQRLYLAALFMGLVVLALAGMAARRAGSLSPARRRAAARVA